MKNVSGVIRTIWLSIQATGKKNSHLYRRPVRRKTLMLVIAVLILCGGHHSGAGASPVNAAKRYYFDLPALPLRQALSQVAMQSGHQLVFSSALVGQYYSKPIRGRYTVTKALGVLLKGSSLFGSVTERGVIVIAPVSARITTTEGIEKMNNRKNILAATIGFFAGAGMVPGVMGQENAELSKGEMDWLLEEVVVTANKREQDLQDIAMSITVLNAEEIDRKGLVSMHDYLHTVPGVSMIDAGPGANQVVIRGIGLSQAEQSTVSAYFGEVPLTSPVGSGFAGSGSSTDMKMVDLERVEVLRGPQGTLYGSGAMGGTIRHIPVEPKLDIFEGKFNVGYSGVSHSNDTNNKLVGVLNLPVVDNLALRVAAYRFDKAGYIDRVSSPSTEALATALGATVSTKKDVGGHTYTGGRASLRWQANDKLDINLMWATQTLEEDGDTRVNLRGGGYKRDDFTQTSLNVPAPIFSDDQFDLTNLVINYDIDWASLTASYAHFEGTFERQSDLLTGTPSLAGVVDSRLIDKKGDTIEIRLASQLQGPLQFIGGLYYEDFELQDSWVGEWYGSAAALANSFLVPVANGKLGPNGLPLVIEFPPARSELLEQQAIFGELVYSFNSQWALTVGARRFDYNREDSEEDGFIIAPIPGGSVDSSKQGTNLKTNITYTPNDNALVYFQWAEGFRVGRGQVLPPESLCDTDNNGKLDFTNAPLDPSVNYDSTTNFELGGKFTLLDNSLTLNATLYRVDWKDIPIKVFDTTDTCPGTLAVDVNGGEARSEGLELETKLYVSQNLQLFLSASFMETEFLDDTVGKSGDRLPLSPRINGSIGIDYSFELEGYNAFFRSDYSYTGGYESVVEGGLPIVDAESYGKLNLRTGIDIDQWSVEFYVDNLSNENAVTIGWNLDVARLVTPRTIGFDVGYTF